MVALVLYTKVTPTFGFKCHPTLNVLASEKRSSLLVMDNGEYFFVILKPQQKVLSSYKLQ